MLMGKEIKMKIIVDIAGGFGNQLFSYAFGYAVSHELGAEFFIDTSMQDSGIARELELLNFNVIYDKKISYIYKKDVANRAIFNKIRKKNLIGWKTSVYREKEPTVYENGVFGVKNNTYFVGNWQSEKYFRKYEADIRKLFVPATVRSTDVDSLMEEYRGINSVAVHIRRGDYVGIGCHLDMLYYDMAIDLMLEKNPEPFKLVIFSDDIEFCKKYFEKYQNKIVLEYPTYESDNYTLDDMLLMSSCRNIIMANSSYSWWAAWLNKNKDKIVICPELGMWSGDFYPEEWIKIQCDNINRR